MIDLSIVIPAIRPARWAGVYDSIKNSCTKYSFEIVFVGPYDPPDELKNNPQIKYIKDWGGSPRCAQIGLLAATGRLLIRGDDDGHFYSNAIDQCIDLLDKDENVKNAVALRYREGRDFQGKEMPLEYWFARFHFNSPKKSKHINKLSMNQLHLLDHYVVCMNLITDRQYTLDIGGFDCRFEHLGFANHDFCYRIQRAGGHIHLSPIEAINVDFEKHGDHIPIEQCHIQHDWPLLNSIYSDPNVINRVKIDIDNWKSAPAVWSRRFGNKEIENV